MYILFGDSTDFPHLGVELDDYLRYFYVLAAFDQREIDLVELLDELIMALLVHGFAALHLRLEAIEEGNKAILYVGMTECVGCSLLVIESNSITKTKYPTLMICMILVKVVVSGVNWKFERFTKAMESHPLASDVKCPRILMSSASFITTRDLQDWSDRKASMCCSHK
jgi:hypothetical protein